MFKSKDEAYLKSSSFKSKSCILGIGNGFLLILFFSSLKSEMKQTVSFLWGIINVGAAHSELIVRFKTLMIINVIASIFRVSSCTFGIGNGLAWYSLAPSRTSILHSVPA